VSTRLDLAKLQDCLRTTRFGRSIFFSRRVSSTNEWAKELAKLGVEEGTVAVAETQTAGRGRLRREWSSPAGGLWFSVVLRPRARPTDAVGLVFVAGLAVAEVLSEKYGLHVETKWPNDVLVHEKKICGMLCEMSSVGGTVKYVIVGVGINANFRVSQALSEDIRGSATSVEDQLGRKVRLEELFGALLWEMERVYGRWVDEGLAPVLAGWKRHAAFLGREVEVSGKDERLVGVALDVSDDGALALGISNGDVRHVLVGDVSSRPR